MNTQVSSHTADKATWRKSSPQVLFSLFLALLFGAAAYTALGLGLGSVASPAPGLWPMLAASIGLVLSASFALTTLLGMQDCAAELFKDVKWRQTMTFVLAIVAFLALYPLIGFLYAAIPMTFVLLKYAADSSWIPSIIVSFVAPVLLYFLFGEVLNVRL